MRVHRVTPGWLRVAIGAALMTVGSAARASPAVEPLAPCSGDRELAARLADEGRDGVDVRLEAIELAPGSWQATVAIDGRAPRRLRGGSCRDVVDAALVVVLLDLDGRPPSVTPGTVTGDRGVERFIEVPGSPIVSHVAPAVPPRRLAVVSGAPAAPGALIPLVRVQVLVENGTLPGATAGEEVDLALEHVGWSLVVGAVALQSRTAEAHSKRVRIALSSARLLGCRVSTPWVGCLGADLGVLGVDAPSQGSAGGGRWLALSADAAFEFPLAASLRGFFNVSGHLALARPRVVFDDGELIDQPGRLSLRVGLGVARSFP